MEEGFLGPRCILQFPFHRFQFVPIIWPFRPPPPGNPHQTFEDPGYSANNKRGTITAFVEFVEFVEGVVNTTCNITTPVPKSTAKGTQPARNPETAPLCNASCHHQQSLRHCEHRQNHPIPASHIYRSGYQLHGWHQEKEKKKFA